MPTPQWWTIAVFVPMFIASLPIDARAGIGEGNAWARLVAASTIGQAAVDPVIEEPIRPLQPGHASPSPEDSVLPAGTELPAATAARCGAAGPLMPAMLALSLGVMRWRPKRR